MTVLCMLAANHITLNFNNKISRPSIFLDIKKKTLKITNRKFKVLVEGELSTPRNIVAQSCSLNPVININHISSDQRVTVY
jgi:hypothetical protein